MYFRDGYGTGQSRKFLFRGTTMTGQSFKILFRSHGTQRASGQPRTRVLRESPVGFRLSRGFQSQDSLLSLVYFLVDEWIISAFLSKLPGFLQKYRRFRKGSQYCDHSHVNKEINFFLQILGKKYYSFYDKFVKLKIVQNYIQI